PYFVFLKFFPRFLARGVFIIGRIQTDGFRVLERQAQAGSSEARNRLFQVALPLIEGVVRCFALKAMPNESLSDRVKDVCRRVLVSLWGDPSIRPQIEGSPRRLGIFVLAP